MFETLISFKSNLLKNSDQRNFINSTMMLRTDLQFFSLLCNLESWSTQYFYPFVISLFRSALKRFLLLLSNNKNATYPLPNNVCLLQFLTSKTKLLLLCICFMDVNFICHLHWYRFLFTFIQFVDETCGSVSNSGTEI